MQSDYEVVIGLEIHAQLNTASKMFCPDSTNSDATDNENVSPISAGMPGTLPVLNRRAIEASIKTGLALGCTIREKSVFARKNYFYPDMPKGYQISQYDKPLCEDGQVSFDLNGVEKTIRIQRAHMEEDAGKSTHFGEYTLINLNRAGVPLLEIVTHPDIRSPQEAAEYAKVVRQILRYLDVCDGNLEEGSLRCDCNISVRKKGEQKLGTKVEIKNINSFRFVEKALEYEIDRQIDLVQKNEKIIQETRLYDSDKNRTFSMRKKEDAQDYRYFPEPDLLPLQLTAELILKIKNEIGELPIAKRNRFMKELSLSYQDADTLTAEKEVADYFEATIQKCKNAKIAANWILTELLRELKTANISIQKSKIQPEQLGQLVDLIDSGKISGKIAKTVFAEMWASGDLPENILKNKGLAQINDSAALAAIVDQVISANPKQVLDYKSGQSKIFGFFVGQIMRQSKGQANPDLVSQILTEKLKK